MSQYVLGIGGLFFRAKDPDALAAWYMTHLGIGFSETGPWVQQPGPTVFAPFPENSDYFAVDKSWMLNLRVSDLDALTADLAKAGIEAETRPDEWDSAVGRFARIHDPEGNAIELWEPAG